MSGILQDDFTSKKFSIIPKIVLTVSNYFILSSILSPFIHFVFEDESFPYPTPFFFLIFFVPSSSIYAFFGDLLSYYYSYLKFLSYFLLNKPVKILSRSKIVMKKLFFNAYSLNYGVLSMCKIYETIFSNFWLDEAYKASHLGSVYLSGRPAKRLNNKLNVYLSLR